MAKILVADPIHPEGVQLLQSSAQVDVKTGLKPDELMAILPDYDALVVRSETKVTSQVLQSGRKLVVVGRAGVGIDNIDLEAATRRGIAVVNSPTGNIIAAAEHTLALMLAVARNIPQACQSLKEGQWKRSQYMGVELRNKTLGIVGLGKVGSEVARRARAFGMRLVAYDPFVSPDYASNLGVEMMPLDRLLKESDFVTLHTPLNESTRHLIGKEQVAQMKPGARLINVARGELVDEAALLAGLEEGKLAGVALDVFAQEPPAPSPLLSHPKVVVTPHLGASTAEAQREVAVEIAQQVLQVLRGEPPRYLVNAPVLPPEVQAVIAPYLPLATMLGKLLTQLASGQVIGVEIKYQGDIAQHNTALVRSAVLMGLLGPVTEERVNLINAPIIASQRGLKVTEQKQPVAEHYGSLVTASLKTTADGMTLSGTLLRGEAHIVQVNEYWLDVVPSAPYLLFIEHVDRPGMIGALGTITGRHDINISFMEVGRLAPRGRAMMILGLDDPVPPEVMAEIRAIPHLQSAVVARL